MDGQRIPGAPNEVVDSGQELDALRRGVDALTERVEELEQIVARLPLPAMAEAIRRVSERQAGLLP